MSTLRSLKQSARESAIGRGHDMTSFKRLEDHVYESACKVCYAHVYVNTHLAPNDIDITGLAVACNCPAEGDNKERIINALTRLNWLYGRGDVQDIDTESNVRVLRQSSGYAWLKYHFDGTTVYFLGHQRKV